MDKFIHSMEKITDNATLQSYIQSSCLQLVEEKIQKAIPLTISMLHMNLSIDHS